MGAKFPCLREVERRQLELWNLVFKFSHPRYCAPLKTSPGKNTLTLEPIPPSKRSTDQPITTAQFINLRSNLWRALSITTLLPAVLAAPSSITTKPTPTAKPCAAVSSALQNAAAQVIPAQLEYECLLSVPVDVKGGIQQIEDSKLYLQWLTTTAFMKNQPATSHEPPYDLYGELDKILGKLKSGKYKSEYVFQKDVLNAIFLCHDGHVIYGADILLDVISFTRAPEAALTSISIDGVSLPKLYSLVDVTHAAVDTSFKPSAVTKINGKSAEGYLNNLANILPAMDIEARYNSLLYNQATTSTGTPSLGHFHSQFIYDGPTTNFTFENGTSKSFTNIATVLVDFTGVNNGETFFKKFCSGPSSTSASATSATATASSVTSTQPAPTVNVLSGYFLNDTGYQDVAILSMPTFNLPYIGPDSAAQVAFQSVVREFLAECRAANKTHLVVDLRGNTGGNTVLAPDALRQLFPTTYPWAGLNFRDNEAYHVMGQTVSKYLEGGDLKTKNVTEYDLARLSLEPVDYKSLLTADNQKFHNFAEMFGPVKIHNDNFTKVLTSNYSDPFSYSYPGFVVTGFLNDSEPRPQPFAADNVIMVRSVAIGGRANNYPMAGVGDTKGAVELGWINIHSDAKLLYGLVPESERAYLNSTDVGKLISATQALKRAAGSGQLAHLNAANNLRKGDKSLTPLQFFWEAADEKIFNTAQMIVDPTAVWRAAYGCGFHKLGCVKTVAPK
ncbi:hypothetical protein H2200_012960 [Cladophialophora chaetospira]|uniref:Tail specific protease domain-containing protein n=1 Tax=Cladophialophora chaetospira TaxID=386627 RepID=A0AA39CBM2_9EURO|nr:hypothetical protein H2200_012960 [Cladophialophora chaetospira]